MPETPLIPMPATGTYELLRQLGKVSLADVDGEIATLEDQLGKLRVIRRSLIAPNGPKRTRRKPDAPPTPRKRRTEPAQTDAERSAV